MGFVVGVKGSKVFCLQMDSMKTVDVRDACFSYAIISTAIHSNHRPRPSLLTALRQVPQSASMHKFLQKGDIMGAHAIALLGVTESDWRLLGESPNMPRVPSRLLTHKPNERSAGDAALRKLEFDLARQA